MASWRGSRNWHEFEDKSACDKAYKKMDKTLIDDRRIHVDFSQSASKLGIQYKHKGGRGCFKCGSPDYIAKVSAKYIVKDESASKKGGDDGSRRLNVSIYKR